MTCTRVGVVTIVAGSGPHERAQCKRTEFWLPTPALNQDSYDQFGESSMFELVCGALVLWCAALCTQIPEH